MNKENDILYVDDEPINLQLFKLHFGKKYSVITANSGYLGLEILNDNRSIKVVISDMRMPGMNGLDFIKKAKEKFPEITFYILTGFDITGEIAEALESGLINKYFRKPFNLKEIESSLPS